MDSVIYLNSGYMRYSLNQAVLVKYEFLVNHANDKLLKHKQNQEQLKSVKANFETKLAMDESKLAMDVLVLELEIVCML